MYGDGIVSTAKSLRAAPRIWISGNPSRIDPNIIKKLDSLIDQMLATTATKGDVIEQDDIINTYLLNKELIRAVQDRILYRYSKDQDPDKKKWQKMFEPGNFLGQWMEAPRNFLSQLLSTGYLVRRANHPDWVVRWSTRALLAVSLCGPAEIYLIVRGIKGLLSAIGATNFSKSFESLKIRPEAYTRLKSVIKDAPIQTAPFSAESLEHDKPVAATKKAPSRKFDLKEPLLRLFSYSTTAVIKIRNRVQNTQQSDVSWSYLEKHPISLISYLVADILYGFFNTIALFVEFGKWLRSDTKTDLNPTLRLLTIFTKAALTMVVACGKIVASAAIGAVAAYLLAAAYSVTALYQGFECLSHLYNYFKYRKNDPARAAIHKEECIIALKNFVFTGIVAGVALALAITHVSPIIGTFLGTAAGILRMVATVITRYRQGRSEKYQQEAANSNLLCELAESSSIGLKKGPAARRVPDENTPQRPTHISADSKGMSPSKDYEHNTAQRAYRSQDAKLSTNAKAAGIPQHLSREKIQEVLRKNPSPVQRVHKVADVELDRLDQRDKYKCFKQEYKQNFGSDDNENSSIPTLHEP